MLGLCLCVTQRAQERVASACVLCLLHVGLPATQSVHALTLALELREISSGEEGNVMQCTLVATSSLQVVVWPQPTLSTLSDIVYEPTVLTQVSPGASPGPAAKAAPNGVSTAPAVPPASAAPEGAPAAPAAAAAPPAQVAPMVLSVAVGFTWASAFDWLSGAPRGDDDSVLPPVTPAGFCAVVKEVVRGVTQVSVFGVFGVFGVRCSVLVVL